MKKQPSIFTMSKPRKKARGHTMIPFPVAKKRQGKKQLYSSFELSADFESACDQASKYIDTLFDFLTSDQQEEALNIKKMFSEKISNGDISTVPEILTFLLKAEELSHCLNTYLEKNAYNENFAKDVSYDIFKHGFSPKNQSEIEEKYPDYF